MSTRTTCLFLAVFPLVSICAAAPSVPTVATEALMDAKPGLRAIAGGGSLSALYGVPIAEDSDSQTDTREFVEFWLFDDGGTGNKDALGVDGVTLVFDRTETLMNGKFEVLTYRQKIENLPVEHSVAVVMVLLGQTEKITYIGMNLVAVPDPALPSSNEITAATAVGAAGASPLYDHLTFSDPADAVKVVYRAKDGSAHRAWRFFGSSASESYGFFVDTTSQEIVGVENLVAHGTASGKVKGHHTAGVAADSADNPPQGPFALEGMEVSVYAGSFPGTCPSVDDTVLVGPVQTDMFGDYLITGGFGEGDTVGAVLTGDAVTVWHCGEDDCTDETTGALDLALATRFVECGEIPSGASPTVDLTLNVPPHDEAITAQLNVFTAIERTRDWFLSLRPETASKLFRIAAYTNSPSVVCNGQTILGANTDEDDDDTTPRVQFSSSIPGFCSSTSFSTFVSHEMAHFITTKSTPTGIFANSHLAEALADTIASLSWNTNCIFGGLYNPLPGETWTDDDSCTRDLDQICTSVCERDRTVKSGPAHIKPLAS